ncbi:MAG: hypothetical protein WBM84_19385, partial [Sedimenticolaceae bacterium]
PGRWGGGYELGPSMARCVALRGTLGGVGCLWPPLGRNSMICIRRRRVRRMRRVFSGDFPGGREPENLGTWDLRGVNVRFQHKETLALLVTSDDNPMQTLARKF